MARARDRSTGEAARGPERWPLHRLAVRWRARPRGPTSYGDCGRVRDVTGLALGDEPLLLPVCRRPAVDLAHHGSADRRSQVVPPLPGVGRRVRRRDRRGVQCGPTMNPLAVIGGPAANAPSRGLTGHRTHPRPYRHWPMDRGDVPRLPPRTPRPTARGRLPHPQRLLDDLQDTRAGGAPRPMAAQLGSPISGPKTSLQPSPSSQTRRFRWSDPVWGIATVAPRPRVMRMRACPGGRSWQLDRSRRKSIAK